MSTGTVAEFDVNGQFGLIESDDGQIVLFNLKDASPALRNRFRVGRRVRFVEHREGLAPRATALTPIENNERAP